jgi:predicted DNA-binding transcriptional regulator AlpA
MNGKTTMLLTSRQLAERFQVSIRTIFGWLKAGILPAPLRIGGVLRWRLADIEAWEESRRAQHADAVGEPSLC